MKILHLMLWYKDGLGYQENYLPRMQADLGHEVLIVCTNYFPTALGMKYVADDSETKKIKVIRLSSLPLKPFSTQRIYVGLQKVIKQYKPDIVHSHGVLTFPSFYALIYKNKYGYKLFVDDHNDKENFELDSFYKKIFFSFFKTKMIGTISKRVDKFLSVNPYSYYFLTKILSVPEKKVEYLLLGIDTENYYPDVSERQEIREKLKISPDEFVFVTSGRLEKSKKIDVLIDAFNNIVKNGHINTKLLIIGKINDSYSVTLNNMVREYGIENKVIFQDWLSQNELRKYYNASDVSIMPGKMSGIKDAISCGLPIIVVDDLPVSYLIAHKNGSNYKRDDSRDLFAKMEKFLVEPEYTKSLSINAVEAAQSDLNWMNISRRSLEIYGSVI